jgi:predicted kinase
MLKKRTDKMNIILLSGPPASGKTTLRNRIIKMGTIISPDDYIGYTKENPWTPRAARDAWQKADGLLVTAIERGDNIIVFDATFVSPKKRRKYIKMGKKVGATLICIYCSVLEKTMIERNAARNDFRKVPTSVINKMASSYVPPKKEEGFDFVVEYNSECDEFNGDFSEVQKLLEG